MNTDPADKHKPLFTEEEREAYDSQHVMKSMDDLDVFDSRQIETSRHIDAGGPDAINNLIINGSMVFGTMMQVAQKLPFDVWQRLVFELSLRVQRGDANKAQEILLEQLWLTVQFFQQLNTLTFESIGTKSVSEITKGPNTPPINLKVN